MRISDWSSDVCSSDLSAFALLDALRHRDGTGEGSEVRVPLGDVAIGTLANSGAMAEMLYREDDRERLGNAIWGAFGRGFNSGDGIRFMVAALTAKQGNGLEIGRAEVRRGVTNENIVGALVL